MGNFVCACSIHPSNTHIMPAVVSTHLYCVALTGMEWSAVTGVKRVAEPFIIPPACFADKFDQLDDPWFCTLFFKGLDLRRLFMLARVLCCVGTFYFVCCPFLRLE